MTAEIAILNRQAVALAADSAVTVGVWTEGHPREKIFVANKVFSLSKHEPVGVMIYGSASFMQMPWETVIKDYRRRLGKRRFPHLSDYADNFLEHLRDAAHLASEKDEDLHVRVNLAGYFLSRIVQEIQERVVKNGTLPDATQLGPVVDEVIQRHHQMWGSAPLVLGASVDSVERLRGRIHSLVRTVRDEVFENIPLSESTATLLDELAAFLFTRGSFPRPGNCGIVIAGFGEGDLYPRLRAYDVDGRIAGILHAVERGKIDVGDDTDATIIPFAQREVVDTFLGGVAPQYQTAVENDFAQILEGLPRLVLGQVTGLSAEVLDQLHRQSAKTTKDQFKAYRERLEQYRKEQFSNPIIQMVVALPKEELASMAEALVSLTSLRRRVSLESETVGGPIDVAVISKGDGLIWIKRKHYFRPELNQHFFATYFKEPSDAAD
jgi:hypothetical protein